MIRPQTKQTLTHKGGSKRCKKLKQVKETKMRDAILENVIGKTSLIGHLIQ